MEKSYRQRLEIEPGDTGTRLSLAWCLVVQALYEAGQERMAGRIMAAAKEMSESPDGAPVHEAIAAAARERNARQLLKGCLRQALMVTQLSRDPREKADVEKLRTLVSLSGAGQAILEADEEAARILRELTRAIASEPAAVTEGGGAALAPSVYRRERYS